MNQILRLTLALAMLNLSLVVLAQVPASINYQGRLTSPVGLPLFNEPNSTNDGQIDLVLHIFDAPTGGASVWSQQTNDVAVYNGLFSILLGNLGTNVFAATGQANRWLEVTVITNGGASTLAPRKEIVSVAYALRAGEADTLDGKHASDLMLVGGGPITISDGIISLNYGADLMVSNGSLSVMERWVDVAGDTMSGDLVLSGTARIQGTGVVDSAAVQDATLVDADIATNANIARSKLGEIAHSSLSGLSADDHTQYSGAGWNTNTTLASLQTNVNGLDSNVSNLWEAVGFVVGTNGSEPYKNIQDAIDAAAADGYNAGRQVTIAIKPGRYQENLNLRAGIHLKAEIEDGLFSVVVVGNHAYNYAGAADGDLIISGVAFYSPGVTATNPLFRVSGSGYTSLRMNSCVLQSTDFGPALRLENTGTKGGRPSNMEMYHSRIRNLQPTFNAMAVDLASGSLLMDEADIWLANPRAKSFLASGASQLLLDNAQIRGQLETRNNAYLQLTQSSIDSGDRHSLVHNSATPAVTLQIMLITTLPGEVTTGTGSFLYSHVGFFYSAYGLYQKLPHNPHALPIRGVDAANVGYDAANTTLGSAHDAWEVVLGVAGPIRVDDALDALILEVRDIWENLPFDEVDPQVGAIAANNVPSWDADEVNEAGDLGMLVTGTIFDDRANGEIGIGTDDPTARLDVDGQVRIRGGDPDDGDVLTSDGDGFATWEAIPFPPFPDEVDPQVGVIDDNFVPSWDADGVNEAGDLGMLVTGTIFDDRARRRIGIGTGNPEVPLHHVGRDTTASNVTQVTRISDSAAGATVNREVYRVAGTDLAILETVQNGNVNFYAGGVLNVPELTLTTGGNVGIGTVNPAARLDVRSATDWYLLALDEGTSRHSYLRAGNPDSGVVIIGDRQTHRTVIQPNGGNVGVGTYNPSSRLHISQAGANDRDHGLYIQRAGTEYGAVMYMDPDGVARIGTKSDSGTDYDTDHIFLNPGNGNVYASGTAYLRLRGDNSAGNASVLEFYDRTSDHNWQIGMGDTSQDNDLKFSKGTLGSAGLEFMRITAAGNVGVGTPLPDPGAKLDVNGRIRIRGGETVNGYVLTSDDNGLASWRPVGPGGQPETDPQVYDYMDQNMVARWRGTYLTGGSMYNLDNGNV
ncbi:MAG: hypothetical protein HYV35_11955, partial [Lentisphaerae bacterium]|nr:hypothetical protein [Lentisphaerota bacterium]